MYGNAIGVLLEDALSFSLASLWGEEGGIRSGSQSNRDARLTEGVVILEFEAHC
jgi:hypothetical protein